VKGVYLKKISLSSTMGAGIRIDQTLAGLERNAGLGEPGSKRRVHGLSQCRGVASVWKVDDGAVLGNNGIYETEGTSDPTKLREDPAGDKQYLDAPTAGISNRVKHG
jgi:hypothetical protein